MASGGKSGEVLFHVLGKTAAGRAGQRPVAQVEPELGVLAADEVQHDQACLIACTTQAPAELLQEDRCALSGAQHEDRVHSGQIDTLIEQVNREEDLQVAGSKS